GHLERLNTPWQNDTETAGPHDRSKQDGDSTPRKTTLANDSAEKRTDSSQQLNYDSHPWWIRMWAWKPWKRVFTDIVVLDGIGYAIVTYNMWHDANRNFRIEQRPWITVELVPSESGGQRTTITTTAGSL